MSRIEELLVALIGGEDMSNYECKSRIEHYLKKCCLRESCNMTPESRVEVLLKILAEELSSGGGSSIFKEFIERTLTQISADDFQNATSVGDYAFYYYENLTNVSLPNSITSIGSNAFSDCDNLSNIDMSNNITIIKNNAFYGCGALLNISLPNSLTSIGNNAFYNCFQLKTLTIPESVINIGTNAFYQNTRITKIIFSGQAPNLQDSAFYSCSSVAVYDFRNCTEIPTLFSRATLGHATGCQIVVPDALYNTWQTSNAWSSLTNVVWVKASEYQE